MVTGASDVVTSDPVEPQAAVGNLGVVIGQLQLEGPQRVRREAGEREVEHLGQRLLGDESSRRIEVAQRGFGVVRQAVERTVTQRRSAGEVARDLLAQAIERIATLDELAGAGGLTVEERPQLGDVDPERLQDVAVGVLLPQPVDEPVDVDRSTEVEREHRQQATLDRAPHRELGTVDLQARVSEETDHARIGPARPELRSPDP